MTMKYNLSNQSLALLSEWNATVTGVLNASYVLDSSRCTMVSEVCNGQFYSRIHRHVSGKLILEERKTGGMYPMAYEIAQDFSELDMLLANKLSNNK